MMQSYASAAKLRSGGPFSFSALKAKETRRDSATNRHRRPSPGRTGPKLFLQYLGSLCRPKDHADWHHTLSYERPHGDRLKSLKTGAPSVHISKDDAISSPPPHGISFGPKLRFRDFFALAAVRG
jgi:hypothetical protein